MHSRVLRRSMRLRVCDGFASRLGHGPFPFRNRFWYLPCILTLRPKHISDTVCDPFLGPIPPQVSLTGLTEPWTSVGLRHQACACPTAESTRVSALRNYPCTIPPCRLRQPNALRAWDDLRHRRLPDTMYSIRSTNPPLGAAAFEGCNLTLPTARSLRRSASLRMRRSAKEGFHRLSGSHPPEKRVIRPPSGCQFHRLRGAPEV